MKTLNQLHTAANEIFETKNYSEDASYSEALQENFEFDSIISSNDLGLEGMETFAKIYNFEDGYAVLIDCASEGEEVKIFDAIDEAQKFATERVFELAS